MAVISIVVPVYRAEDCLPELYRRLKESLHTISDDFEIVLVEDASPDHSWDVIAGLARADKRVKGVRLSRNFGQHYAITAGLDHCDGDWIVVMDCDLQDRPEEIPRLYRKALEGYDVVLAVRTGRRDSPMKCLTSWLFYKFFSYLSDIDYDPRVGNFRIISRRVRQNLLLIRERLRFFGGMVKWVGFSTASIEVDHASRFKGETTYTFRKLLTLTMDIIIAYSDKPLRITIGFGFMMALFSFIMGCHIMLRALIHASPVAGWSSLIVSLYFIGGIIIFILGIIGIYLGKTFDEAKKRPLYIVMDVTF
ncbi:MAG: glycosyltransferase family 2 protein [Candidatus Omnitrophota bacterium]